jgi:hypothetical protein
LNGTEDLIGSGMAGLDPSFDRLFPLFAAAILWGGVMKQDYKATSTATQAMGRGQGV